MRTRRAPEVHHSTALALPKNISRKLFSKINKNATQIAIK